MIYSEFSHDLLNRFEKHVADFIDLDVWGEDERIALANDVEADLSSAAGVEKVSTSFADLGAGAWRFEATVRIGPREWLPDFVGVIKPYANGERRKHRLASVR